MSETYAKLFSSILDSTIWGESHATRIVWVTMLASKNKHGIVDLPVPGLARRAHVTLEECETALAKFLAPDPYSRTPDFEGRRIEKVPGGWRLLNHALYRDKGSDESRRQQNRDAKRRERERKDSGADNADSQQKSAPVSTNVSTGHHGSALSAHTDTDTDTDKSKSTSGAREITPAAAACIAMKAAGCVRVNPSNPDLLAALAEGVEPATLGDCAREAVEAGKRNPFAYAIQVARGRHNDGAAPVGASHGNRPPSSNGSRRLSVVEQVQQAIDERREREAGGGETVDGTCERTAAG